LLIEACKIEPEPGLCFSPLIMPPKLFLGEILDLRGEINLLTIFTGENEHLLGITGSTFRTGDLVICVGSALWYFN
jgi:hypothetical protein